MAWSPVERRVIESWAGLGLPAGSRILLLSDRDSRWPALLGEAGLEAEWHDAAEPLPRADRRFAGAMVAGVLETNEWDRWMVQQAAARLEPDAPVVLVTRNLTSLASPGDAAWLAGRIVREAAPRILRLAGLGRTAAPRRFAGRRYGASRLRGLLDRLGFEIERFEAAGAGWTAPLAALAPGQARALARFWVVVARTPRTGVLGGSVPLPPCREHVPAFEREQAQFLANRETWAWQHP
ncbi:MAG TPA: hypothetical protein VMS88_07640, partial [Terriglobales bacterium]|nr:hypothetical protein [Terriglobales bacterium]